MVSSFSLLVPVYNFNVVPLVNQLLQLAKKTTLPFEILLVDDMSSLTFKKQNAALKTFPDVTYIELSENIGRSKIRNLLFEKAKYEYCIILDCDVLLANENFLDRYIQNLSKENIVVGGHVYLPHPPKEKSKYFHWLYGSKIEVKALAERLKNPYASFMTNSFGISKTLFKQLKFEESITEYGHEDTLFGFELKQKKISIVHINNPVVHLGLVNETEFLKKQEKAIQNLVKLYENNIYTEQLEDNVKLVQFYTLFYNKFPYNIIIKLMSFMVTNTVKFVPLNVLRLSAFNFWKLEKYAYYSNKN